MNTLSIRISGRFGAIYWKEMFIMQKFMEIRVLILGYWCHLHIPIGSLFQASLSRHEGSHCPCRQWGRVYPQQAESRRCSQTRRVRGQSVCVDHCAVGSWLIALIAWSTKGTPPCEDNFLSSSVIVQLCPVRRRQAGRGEDVRSPDQCCQAQRPRHCKPAETEDPQHSDQ